MAGIDEDQTVLKTDERDAVLADRPRLVGCVEPSVNRREPGRLEGEELTRGRRDLGYERRHCFFTAEGGGRACLLLFTFRRRPVSPSRNEGRIDF